MIGLINRNRSQHGSKAPSRGISKSPSKRDIRKDISDESAKPDPPKRSSPNSERARDRKCPNFGNVLMLGLNLKRKLANEKAGVTEVTEDVIIPGSEVPKDFVKIDVSGKIFKIRLAKLNRYPQTLLGDPQKVT